MVQRSKEPDQAERRNHNSEGAGGPLIPVSFFNFMKFHTNTAGSYNLRYLNDLDKNWSIANFLFTERDWEPYWNFEGLDDPLTTKPIK